jgi:steroid 5-alpha reductase family enzyme
LWALRLAGYILYTRIRQGHVDKRYTEISSNWKINHSLGFFLNFQLQGLLIFIISFIFYLIGNSMNPVIAPLDYLAIGLVVVGIAGESVADYQLQEFKSKQRGGVCNIGLWKYSRHPNYFFDWLAWLGFGVFALQSNHGYLGLFSILVLYCIFTEITGPITELGSVKSRGQAYIDYQKQTSMFFPWFKKKNDSEETS